MIKNGYLALRTTEITSDFIFTIDELEEALGSNLSIGNYSTDSEFLHSYQGGLSLEVVSPIEKTQYTLWLGTNIPKKINIGVFNQDPANRNNFNFYFNYTKPLYLNLQIVNQPVLSKLLPFIEKTDYIFDINHNGNYFYPYATLFNPTLSRRYIEFNVSIGETQYRDYSNQPFTALGNATYKTSVRSIVTETILDNDLEYTVLWSAGTPVISNGLDEKGKYIEINIKDSPTDTPTGNIYRNGGSEPVGTYEITGNKTAKWYITDSPIGENGDAYTANQIYNGVFGFLSNTVLVNWTYIEWSLHENPNQIIRVSAKDLGSFSNIKIYKNEEVNPIIDKTPSGNYDELFDVSAYGATTYKVVVTPRVGYKFGSYYTDTLYITLDKQTIEVQTEFNEINGELSAVENQYLEQMNVTPDTGWTRKDYRTVVINESGSYTVTLISNSLWYELIPVPATYNITAALDTPVLNYDYESNQLEWKAIENATEYQIVLNGEVIDTVSASAFRLLIEEEEKKAKWRVVNV